MTDDSLARDMDRGNTPWHEVEARYRSATHHLQKATALAEGRHTDVDEAAVMNHAFAARELIETPATHLAHVAVKIRAADNMLGLTASYPDLPRLLLEDICGMIGLTTPTRAFYITAYSWV